ALGPVGTEEDTAAGLDAQGRQLFPPPAVEQLRGLPLLPPHDGDRAQHALGRRRRAPLDSYLAPGGDKSRPTANIGHRKRATRPETAVRARLGCALLSRLS